MNYQHLNRYVNSIEEGKQKIDESIYGKSITDACLGWLDSERLIYDIAESVKYYNLGG